MNFSDVIDNLGEGTWYVSNVDEDFYCYIGNGYCGLFEQRKGRHENRGFFRLPCLQSHLNKGNIYFDDYRVNINLIKFNTVSAGAVPNEVKNTFKRSKVDKKGQVNSGRYHKKNGDILVRFNAYIEEDLYNRMMGYIEVTGKTRNRFLSQLICDKMDEDIDKDDESSTSWQKVKRIFKVA